MKVVLINKSDSSGGASVAATRLANSLHQYGIDVHMLVSDGTQGMLIEVINKSWWAKQKAIARFLWERLYFFKFEKSAVERFSFSPANTGMDLSKHPMIQEADVIHLHWINQGFLSLKNIDQLIKLGKPVVWTFHDMWAFTGGCHYNGACHEFIEACGYCPYLKKPLINDISAQQFIVKKQIYKHANLHLVTCSKWLRSLAVESALLHQNPCFVIPNPIDSTVFKPYGKEECRNKLGLPQDKKILLFGAANIHDPRKGIRYLIEALNILHENFPILHDKLELVVFGKAHKSDTLLFPFKTTYFQYINNQQTLVELYNASDAYILPSLQDNLPNTVMEAMACAVPVIGFRIGGVPEMIEHGISGYLSEVKNSMSLSSGIYETLFISESGEMGLEARRRVMEQYSGEKVAAQYVAVYEKALKAQ